jgi:hypothetical protein
METMALPETIRVKLSSEAAESIALTPVVVQEMAVRELVEHVLGITGKDEARIRDLLLRGTLVSGASRFRWAGWEAGEGDVRALLATFPDAEPGRAFAAAGCVRAILRGGRQAIDIPREAGARKGFFQRQSFWDTLMAVAGAGAADYLGYSYRDRADRYRRAFNRGETATLRSVARGIRYSTLRDQVNTVAFTEAELIVQRL